MQRELGHVVSKASSFGHGQWLASNGSTPRTREGIAIFESGAGAHAHGETSVAEMDGSPKRVTAKVLTTD